MERTHAEAILEELQLVGKTHVGKVHEGLYPIGCTVHWSKGRPSREKSSCNEVCGNTTED